MTLSFSPIRIRSAREAAGLTREQVCVAIGRSARTVELWERGLTVPPNTVGPLLARALGCTVAELREVVPKAIAQ